MKIMKVTNELKIAELNATIAEELGYEIDAVSGEYYADPQFANVYAGRVTFHGETMDVLVDLNTREVEEDCEFATWPPTTRPL